MKENSLHGPLKNTALGDLEAEELNRRRRAAWAVRYWNRFHRFPNGDVEAHKRCLRREARHGQRHAQQ